MKKISFIIIMVLYVLFNSFNYESEIKDNVNKLRESEECDVKKITLKQLLKMNSKLESNHKWDVANKFGYLGRYQIGKSALLDLGYDTLWVEKVHNSIYVDYDTTIIDDEIKVKKFYYFDLNLFPKAKQEEAIKKFLIKNEKVYLKKHIKKYVGKKIGGVRITKAGILSASFIGTRFIDKYLSSGGKINLRDGNGHSFKQRLKMFENYELEK